MTDSLLNRMLGKMHGASDCDPTSSTPVKKPPMRSPSMSPIGTDYHVSSDEEAIIKRRGGCGWQECNDEANNANEAVDGKNANEANNATSVVTNAPIDTDAAAKAAAKATSVTNAATKAAARSPTGKNARAKPKSAEKPVKKTATAGEKNAAKKAAAKSAAVKKPAAKPKHAEKPSKKPAVRLPEKEDAAEMVASENKDGDTDLVDVPMTQAHAVSEEEEQKAKVFSKPSRDGHQFWLRTAPRTHKMKMKQARDAWTAMTEDQKQVYKDKAREERVAHGNDQD
jgi:hypothetical protein